MMFTRNTGGSISSPGGPIAGSYLSCGNEFGGNPNDGGRRKTRGGDLISKFNRTVSPSPSPLSWLFCS